MSDFSYFEIQVLGVEKKSLRQQFYYTRIFLTRQNYLRDNSILVLEIMRKV